MIKKIAAVICTAVMTFSLTGCSLKSDVTKEIVHNVEVPPQLLFLGDSIPAGYGLEGYSDDDLYNCASYPNILGDRYKEELADSCGHTMINRSESGARSEDLIALLDSGDLDEDLKNSDAIIVSIGGNDMLGILLNLLSEAGYSPEEEKFNFDEMNLMSAASSLFSMGSELDEALDNFEKNIVTISEKINLKTDGQLYIQTLYDPLESYEDISVVENFVTERMDRFNTIVAQNAGSKYKVIDIYAQFKGRNEKLTNIKDLDIHPNAEGHQVIAEAVDLALRSTGFSYTTTEVTGSRMTFLGKLLIVLSVILVLLLLLLTFLLIPRKKKL